MQRLQAATLRWNLRALDALAVALTFVASAWVRQALRAFWHVDLVPGAPILAEVTLSNQWHLGALAIPAWLAALQRTGAYEDVHRVRSDLHFLRVLRGGLGAGLLLLTLLFLLQPSTPTSRSLLIGFSLASIFTVFLARRAFLRRAGGRLFGASNVLVVGDAGDAAPLMDSLRRRSTLGLRLVGRLLPGQGVEGARDDLPVLGRLSDLPAVLARENVSQVFVTGRARDPVVLREVADTCEELGVTLSMDANFLGLRTSRAEVQDVEGWSVLSFSSTPMDGDALLVKRAMDVAGATLALLLASPMLLLVALAIKLEDGGPIFFVQQRSGLYGRVFPMLKFRSMCVDAEKRKAALERLNEMSGPVFKMAEDPRITRVGRFIRRTSLDEFPQFWNVLRGEMSLVGPRPPLPSEVDRYARWQMRRLSMKPGITCIWQVSGRNNVDFDTWMRLDLQYIDSWSLFLDVKLLLRTIPAVISGSGAR
jgi:exopolysaccharide biosynthesis polyprenyl glycosylphosphotransferase